METWDMETLSAIVSHYAGNPLWCHWMWWICIMFVNTLRPRQNGRHFTDNTFKYIFVNGNVIMSAKISLKFVSKGPINNIPALVQIMAWRRPGDKPLSEPMMVRLLTHICVTRPQWLKHIALWCYVTSWNFNIGLVAPSHYLNHSWLRWFLDLKFKLQQSLEALRWSEHWNELQIYSYNHIKITKIFLVKIHNRKCLYFQITDMSPFISP